MLHALSDHIEEVAALILFGIGFSNLLLNRHMMKKIIGFSMMEYRETSSRAPWENF